jgi:D-alanyl-D-alanine carboxypeptidase/D-alanyl-D-alanine-endopeptidase (penicillin-binding protein 4)
MIYLNKYLIPLIMPLMAVLTAWPTQACPALIRDLDIIVNQSQFRTAQFGISIQTQGSNPLILYSHNADRLLIPASNAKLLTTAAAIQALPLDFTVKTTLYDLGNNQFHLVGEGDPMFKTSHLQTLAQSLKDHNIKQIKRLTLDDRYYGPEWLNPHWGWDDVQADYAPPINGLILNENAIGLTLTPATTGQPLIVKWNEVENSKRYRIENLTKTVTIEQPEFVNLAQPKSGLVRVTGQLRVGAEPEPVGISVQQPTQYMAEEFRRSLLLLGIKVDTVEIASISKEPKGIVSEIISPPLSEWIYETNQTSNNLYAEALLRQLGRSDLQPMGTGYSSDRGLIVLRQQLMKMGIAPETYQMVDGSGLARLDWVSAGTLVQVLQAMAENSTFRKSLPIAGKSGSLTRRFKDTSAQTILSAKTGFLTGAIGLSGYVNPKNFSPIVFSILLNNSIQPLSEQMKAVDAIAIRLANLKECKL